MIYNVTLTLFAVLLASSFLASNAFVQSPQNGLAKNALASKVKFGPIKATDEDEEIITDLEAYEAEKRKKAPKGMFNAEGKPYAPWMMDSVDAEKAKQAQENRRARKAAEKKAAQGALLVDPQAMELSGVGLKTKMVGDECEISWGTGDETGNKGFIITKRRGGSDDWQVVASYTDWAPLNSKGPAGGQYTYMDSDTEQGTWIYRVSDVNTQGQTSDLCQALVEVQDQGQQMATKAFAVGIIGVFGALLAAGLFLDPLQ
mmetsp:Transcript_21892/g.34404  ORF Transcript_21892/g.34404 Transcript_21892/m.34404 type:complete len:259 (+) Transcript_21892:50-826(+)|eukprot:CAMPEP_0194575216 /NCGR_PEP_ID=MMETSP0292-20121207/10767_1 /TAXON_ID=39354 /ORGANISM="Heterosigma akashiwo, Strain CCMP2393" /LENGTH=258 /DNA_ID=CAMNT_0039426915 /DNA_START=78 /DNA_END=854 /DNA_ORIENTATION=+